MAAMHRKTFGFKDSYAVTGELRSGALRAAELMASDETENEHASSRSRKGSQQLQLDAASGEEAVRQLEAAEEYAMSLKSLPWLSVKKVVNRIAALREEVIDLAEACQTTMRPEELDDGSIRFKSALGPLTIADIPGAGAGGGEAGGKVLTLSKSDGATVVVELLAPPPSSSAEGDRTVREKLSDGSSIGLSDGDNILTESFNDGCVSRLDRRQYLKTVQLAPADGSIIVQAVLHGPRRGHVTIQCMDGTVVIFDEAGQRTQRLTSPRRRPPSHRGAPGAGGGAGGGGGGGNPQSPRGARPPKGPPPASTSPRNSVSPRSSVSLSPLAAGSGGGGGGEEDGDKAVAVANSSQLERRQSRGSLFRQLTAEKMVVPARLDVSDGGAGEGPALPDAAGGTEGKIQWRCIRRLWIHAKPATLSGLVRHMEIGETVVQVRA
jgi:hypothetical protein